jgi:hypothetical protein
MSSETIYIPLLDEGTTVWRPALADPIRDGVFCINSEMPDDEEWAFKPGQKVIVRHHVFSDGKSGLVADGLAIEEASIPSACVELASDELMVICNALNEVCNGVGLGDEFETRMGSTVDAARNLLARLSAFGND